MAINKVTKGRAGSGISQSKGLTCASAASVQLLNAPLLNVQTVTAASTLTVPSIALGGLDLRTIRVTMTSTAASGTEINSGVTIPAKSVILNVFIDMATGASGISSLYDVGTLSGDALGDADGLLAVISVATSGLAMGSMVSTAQTYGALLKVTSGVSAVVYQPAIIAVDRVLTYTARQPISSANGEIVLLIAKL